MAGEECSGKTIILRVTMRLSEAEEKGGGRTYVGKQVKVRIWESCTRKQYNYFNSNSMQKKRHAKLFFFVFLLLSDAQKYCL